MQEAQINAEKDAGGFGILSKNDATDSWLCTFIIILHVFSSEMNKPLGNL